MRVHDDWLLTPEGVALHEPTGTGVLADLHLGYNEARRRRGDAVPLMGVAPLLAPLAALLARHSVRKVVIAGDLFEDAGGVLLFDEMLAWLGDHDVALAGVVPGNHDRILAKRTGDLPIWPDGLDIGGWRVLHGDGRLPVGPVIHGHIHPCLRWGGNLSAPCYLMKARRLILPAFSPDARGVNVVGATRWRSYRCLVCVGQEVLDFGDLNALAKTQSRDRQGAGCPFPNDRGSEE